MIDFAPILAIKSYVTGKRGQISVSASDLFETAYVDASFITEYALLHTQGDGHLVINGATQVVNAELRITSAQLSQTSYAFGSLTGTLTVTGATAVGLGEAGS